jgi:type IV secretion system protein VirB10
MTAFFRSAFLVLLSGAAFVQAQEAPAPDQQLDRQVEQQAGQQMAQKFVVPVRTRIPLVLVNSVSTKTSEVGDQIYLQTSFPINVGGRIVIPEGSYVTGTITQIKRPGLIKGRGEIYVRFDTLMLRNGVQRDFRGTVTATDGSQDDMSESEGTIRSDGTKGRDVGTVAGTTAQGASTGAVIGAVEGSTAKGAAIGAGIGAAVGMIGVLLTRGSEVRLLRGTSMEMQLDRDLTFFADEVNFLGTAPPQALPSAPPTGGTLQNPARGPQLPFPSPFPRANPF